MPSHWGLGMLVNNGDCLDCDYGANADRVMFATKLWGHFIAFMWDWVATGPTTQLIGPQQGQGVFYNADTLDDVSQWVLALGKQDKPEELKEKLDQGKSFSTTAATSSIASRIGRAGEHDEGTLSGHRANLLTSLQEVVGMRECWILLLPGHDDEPVGIEREGGAVETAEELDLAPALGPQHVEQLVRRVAGSRSRRSIREGLRPTSPTRA